MQALHERYRDVRRRTQQIFDLVAPEAFDLRPIPLRHPLRFYEGHLSSFNLGMLLQGGFVKNDSEPELTRLFARGIDPLDTSAADKLTIQRWPERPLVADYIERVDREMERAFKSEIDPIYLHTAVEHEEMHQETLMYLIHRVPYEFKRTPRNVQSDPGSASLPASWIRIEAGSTRLGADPASIPFGWDNEFPQMQADVDAFEISSRKVSNGDFLEFLESGGYENEKLWSEAAWQSIREAQITAPPFWSRQDGEWRYDGLFKSMPLPSGMARLPQPHRSARFCALVRLPVAKRSGVASRLRARRSPASRARQLRLFCVESDAGVRAKWRSWTARWQWVGMDQLAVRRLSRFQAIPALLWLLRGFF